MKRRDFIKLAGLSLFIPRVFASESAAANWQRVLVLVELKGGNDGLNTVVPYSDPNYYRLRPNLGIARNKVLQISETLGLNPVLENLMPVWQDKELAVVSGVGYPQPNRSHFRSIEIWETGSDSDTFMQEGWISRVFSDNSRPADFFADGVVLGEDDLGPLHGNNMRNIVMRNPQKFIREAKRLREVSQKTQNQALQHLLGVQNDILEAADILQNRLQKQPLLAGAKFPGGPLAGQLALAAKLLLAKIPVAVIKVSHRGFDTHSNQRNRHDRLLQQLSEALAAFRQTMKKAGLWDRVLVMTYSEFGRRAYENGSAGTDHGTAAPHFIMGGKVKGGFYGEQPLLQGLDQGDLRYHIDYRSLYNTVINNWWNIAQSPFDKRDFPVINYIH